MWIDVDTAITVPCNVVPIVALSDGYTIDDTIAYNESGMDLNWNFVTTAGVQTQTNITPTTSGVYDWSLVGNGMYKIELPASGGASANNDTSGTLQGDMWVNRIDCCPFVSAANYGQGYVVLIAGLVSGDVWQERCPDNVRWLSNLGQFLLKEASVVRSVRN